MNILFKETNKSQQIILAEVPEPPNVLFDEIKQNLSDEEIDYYFTIKSIKRKTEWLGVRCLLKLLLNYYIEIKYDQTGNPYIENNLHISITHSKKIIGIILSKHEDVGIDTEILSPKILKTAHKFIEEKELAEFREDEKIKRIYLNWCSKETLFKIKAHGGFDFKQNFKIIDFELKKNGSVKSKIIYNHVEEEYLLRYKFIDYNNSEILIVWH